MDPNSFHSDLALNHGNPYLIIGVSNYLPNAFSLKPCPVPSLSDSVSSWFVCDDVTALGRTRPSVPAEHSCRRILRSKKDSIRKIGVCIITVETYVERPTKTIEKLDVHGDASKTKAVALHPKWNLVVNDLQRQTQKLVGVLHSADSDSTPSEKQSQAFLRSPAL